MTSTPSSKSMTASRPNVTPVNRVDRDDRPAGCEMSRGQGSWSLTWERQVLGSVMSCHVHERASRPIIELNSVWHCVWAAIRDNVLVYSCNSKETLHYLSIFLSQRSVLAKRLTLVNDNSEWRRIGNRSRRHSVGIHVRQSFGLLGKVNYFC